MQLFFSGFLLFFGLFCLFALSAAAAGGGKALFEGLDGGFLHRMQRCQQAGGGGCCTAVYGGLHGPVPAYSPQQQRGAHIPAGQTARTGPGSEAADQHRRCGKGRYIPEKAAQRALSQCKAHGIPHARQQTAQPKAPQHIPQHRPRGG